MRDLSEYLEVAETVAREAGACLRRADGNYRHVNDDSGKDVKLQADLESEVLIRRELGARSGLPVIGEEQGGDAGLLLRDEPFWVVDPLDGTYNYLRGHPVCCVSIALMRGVESLLGVIYDFNRDEVISGGPGLGLRIDGHPHTPRWAADIKQAMLQTGFTTAQDYSQDSLATFIRHVTLFKKTRCIGSAALALAWVAAGRSDVYHETSIRLWDVAAGIALIKAGGGDVRMKPLSAPTFAYDVWAGVGGFFPKG